MLDAFSRRELIRKTTRIDSDAAVLPIVRAFAFLWPVPLLQSGQPDLNRALHGAQAGGSPARCLKEECDLLYLSIRVRSQGGPNDEDLSGSQRAANPRASDIRALKDYSRMIFYQ